MTSAPVVPPAPPFPRGPLNPPDQQGDVAVRVGLYLRGSGTVDVVISAEEIRRAGSLDAAVQRRREDLAQDLWEQGGLNEDDVEIEDLDAWNPETQRWDTVEES